MRRFLISGRWSVWCATANIQKVSFPPLFFFCRFGCFMKRWSLNSNKWHSVTTCIQCWWALKERSQQARKLFWLVIVFCGFWLDYGQISEKQTCDLWLSHFSCCFWSLEWCWYLSMSSMSVLISFAWLPFCRWIVVQVNTTEHDWSDSLIKDSSLTVWEPCWKTKFWSNQIKLQRDWHGKLIRRTSTRSASNIAWDLQPLSIFLLWTILWASSQCDRPLQNFGGPDSQPYRRRQGTILQQKQALTNHRVSGSKNGWIHCLTVNLYQSLPNSFLVHWWFLHHFVRSPDQVPAPFCFCDTETRFHPQIWVSFTHPCSSGNVNTLFIACSFSVIMDHWWATKSCQFESNILLTSGKAMNTQCHWDIRTIPLTWFLTIQTATWYITRFVVAAQLQMIS